MRSDQKVLLIRVHPALKEWIAALAEKNSRSISREAERILQKEFVKTQQQRQAGKRTALCSTVATPGN